MKRLFSTLREAGVRFSRDGCAFLAQAVAFNALFALFPLVVLVVTLASYIYPNAEQRVLVFFDSVMPALHDFIAANLQSYIYGRGISSLIALVFILWSGKNLFMGITVALDRSLNVPKGRPFFHSVLLSIVMLPAIGTLLIIAMALPISLSIVMAIANISDRQNLTHFSAYLISIVLVFVISMALYRFLPNKKLTWSFALPGASVTALSWPVLQFAFTQYTLHVPFSHIYGALSVPLVLLLWFYVIGSIFLYGAEFCAAWAARNRGGTSILDEVGARTASPIAMERQ